MADLPFSSTQLLAGVASALLLFVSLGVVYLSTVEWRDRRRRRQDSSAALLKSGARGKGSKAGKAASGSKAGNSSKAGSGSKASSGIRAGRRSSSSGSSPRS